MEKNSKLITYKRYFDRRFFGPQPNSFLEKLYGNKPLLWASTGRGNFYRIVDILKLRNEVVLLPVFCAHGIILPLKRNHVKIQFYKSDKKLQPDLNHISELVAEFKVKAIVIIHYFGVAQDLSLLQNLAKKSNFFIIEDCAQALLSKDRNGGYLGFKGDISIFSINKFIPVSSGSFIRLNRFVVPKVVVNRKSLLSFLSILFGRVSLYFKSIEVENSISLIKFLTKFIGKLCYVGYYKLICYQVNPVDINYTEKQMIDRFNFKLFLTIRDKNIKYALRLINNFHLSYLLAFDLQEGWIGPGLPLLVPDANSLSIYFKNRNIETLRFRKYWFFAPKNQIDQFKIEFDFYNRHILLPVNQQMSKSDIRRIIETLVKYIETTSNSN